MSRRRIQIVGPQWHLLRRTVSTNASIDSQRGAGHAAICVLVISRSCSEALEIPSRDAYPRYEVSDIVAFERAAWLSARRGAPRRLPTGRDRSGERAWVIASPQPPVRRGNHPLFGHASHAFDRSQLDGLEKR
jgi:hypothetical protein